VSETLGPKRNEVRGEWKRLHNEELHALYPSTNTIRIFKPIRMIWVGHVARMGESRGADSVLVRKSEERNHLEDLGVDERIILKWIFMNLRVT
jgi:hypothetical protein